MIDVLFLISILSDWQWETWRSLAHDWVLLEAAESVLMYKRHHHFVFFTLLLPVPLSSWGRQNHQGGTWWKVSNMRAAVQVNFFKLKHCHMSYKLGMANIFRCASAPIGAYWQYSWIYARKFAFPASAWTSLVQTPSLTHARFGILGWMVHQIVFTPFSWFVVNCDCAED